MRKLLFLILIFACSCQAPKKQAAEDAAPATDSCADSCADLPDAVTPATDATATDAN